MPKVYTPEDFPSPKPDLYRDELIEKVSAKIAAGDYKLENDRVIVEIVGDPRYLTSHLVDFQSYYSLHGKWHSVETSRIGSGLITITLTK